ncbi:hypothetical protein SPBR_03280 [Sporothrix brasiliensis 5110]|uniref:Uncharacterized protein n=1 Tax=Sporothrix brasiliensis 5110 TaxID=1398154 RepID=A0A0C2F0S2_9PEZI|nr:uncharacterized protein SPBR_03280 [Sporothrix brasiliensis 5110]KIH92429.1 hypothetical protein SPBR_03280 [Sporothrix brasiliensis 5110]
MAMSMPGATTTAYEDWWNTSWRAFSSLRSMRAITWPVSSLMSPRMSFQLPFIVRASGLPVALVANLAVAEVPKTGWWSRLADARCVPLAASNTDRRAPIDSTLALTLSNGLPSARSTSNESPGSGTIFSLRTSVSVLSDVYCG